MKTNHGKLIAIILAIVICAACTVTGIAVSAADHSNPTSTPASAPATRTAATEHIKEFAKPSLKDGTWKATYEDDYILYFVIDSKENSFAIMNEDGMGVPGRYDYVPAIGMYKIYSGSVGNEKHWRVIDNDGQYAAVSDENSQLITLEYVAPGDIFA